MRFFKAFRVLHRRAKSATFVPGSTGPEPLDAAVPQIVRPSSLPVAGPGQARDRGSGTTLFDFVTSKISTAPANFNHLNVGDRNRDRSHTGIWGSKRRSDGSLTRDSSADMLAMLQKEHMHLREALTMWIQEHAKAQDLLKICDAALTTERKRTHALENQVARDQQLILSLTTGMQSYEKRIGKTQASDDREQRKCLCASPGYSNELALAPVVSVAPSESRVTVQSRRLRSLDEYSSSLRMTLITRKQLREQKKITKFWKSKALSVSNKHQDTVTPSTSQISSVYEGIPPERKPALEALMIQRGLPIELIRTLPCIKDDSLDNPLTVIALPEPFVPVIPSIVSILPSGSSNSSGFSRLDPLASDSLRAEMNILFGTQLGPKQRRSLPHKKCRAGPMSIILTPGASQQSVSSQGLVGKADDPNSSLDSYSDVSGLFLVSQPPNFVYQFINPFPQNTLNQDNSISNSLSSQASGYLPSNVSLVSSFCLAESTIPSGDSQTFGKRSKASQPVHQPSESVATPPKLRVSKSPSVKQASKECTPRRSWQKYIAQPPSVHRESGEKKQPMKKTPTSKNMPAEGKENVDLSTPVIKRRASRLPIPSFVRM